MKGAQQFTGIAKSFSRLCSLLQKTLTEFIFQRHREGFSKYLKKMKQVDSVLKHLDLLLEAQFW